MIGLCSMSHTLAGNSFSCPRHVPVMCTRHTSCPRHVVPDAPARRYPEVRGAPEVRRQLPRCVDGRGDAHERQAGGRPSRRGRPHKGPTLSLPQPILPPHYGPPHTPTWQQLARCLMRCPHPLGHCRRACKTSTEKRRRDPRWAITLPTPRQRLPLCRLSHRRPSATQT